MSIKDKNNHGFTLIELIIVMAIIAILSAIIVPSIGKLSRSKKVEHANYNSKLVFMEVQREVNKIQYANDTDKVKLIYGQYNGTKTVIKAKINSDPVTTLDINLSLSDELMKSSWYACVDNDSQVVKYLVWTQNYGTVPTALTSYTTVSQQNSYNAGVTNLKDLIGLYPRT